LVTVALGTLEESTAWRLTFLEGASAALNVLL
jgi:hypothetical protein